MIFEIAFVFFISLLARVLWVSSTIGNKSTFKKKKVRVLAIAGSGGHTTELLILLKSLSDQYSPRYYVIANTDSMSAAKIENFEKERCSSAGSDYFIETIPRSREVAQPWISSMWTTFVATLHAFSIVWNSDPNVILCNGPGTCIPLCLVGFFYKVLGFQSSHIVFVESICRVKSLSLSGLILYYWADKIFVQWTELQKKYPRSVYLGRIV